MVYLVTRSHKIMPAFSFDHILYAFTPSNLILGDHNIVSSLALVAQSPSTIASDRDREQKQHKAFSTLSA